MRTSKIFYVVLITSLMFFASQNRLHANNDLTTGQLHGMCAGYHTMWAALSYNSNTPNDMEFSLNILAEIEQTYGHDPLYQEAYELSTEILLKAIEEQDVEMAQSFAAVCTELGIPLGQNTKT